MFVTQEHTTKVNIAFISYKYHWESYSVIRSFWECLRGNPALNLVWITREYSHQVIDPDIIFVAGSQSVTPEDINGIPIVRFAFSDPNLYKKDNIVNLYCTNDFNLSKESNNYYFPCFSNKNYFKDLNLEKENDVLFVGVRNHPYIGDRSRIIDKIREQGMSVKCFGDGWEEGFIEGRKLVEEYNKAHLCLDITNKITALGSRIFQSSMCGTPVITLYRQDISKLFNEDEILFYKDIDSIKLALKDKEELRQKGIKARERCLKDHDITIRVADLMEHIYDQGLL